MEESEAKVNSGSAIALVANVCRASLIGVPVFASSRVREQAVLIIGTLVVSCVVAVVQTLPPSPCPRNARPTEFSAERAFMHVRQRVRGSPSYDWPPQRSTR